MKTECKAIRLLVIVMILNAPLMIVGPGISSAAGTESYLGYISLWPNSWEPEGWMFCRGQILQISDYEGLYYVIGNAYGGNGTTTFALPDLRGRTAIGVGQGPGLTTNYSHDQAGGSQSVEIVDKIPVEVGSVGIKADEFAKSGVSVVIPTETEISAKTDTDMIGGKTHENMQPYIGLNYIICVEGYWPSHE